jgi:hypothetical protein
MAAKWLKTGAPWSSINTYKMKHVTPKRCNQLHSVTKQTKALLKERYKGFNIGRFFGSIFVLFYDVL